MSHPLLTGIEHIVDNNRTTYSIAMCISARQSVYRYVREDFHGIVIRKCANAETDRVDHGARVNLISVILMIKKF